jgi:hypothetical protein
MTDKQSLIKEIEALPSAFVDEVYRYVTFLTRHREQPRVKDITLASEQALSKDWMLPEEESAWADL